ncbi:hypothetical protein FGU46_03910 [Methanobacterium sp. CWC-01]|uniref:hypothetical protein n=1 Tax=Methanobacterium aridiramus TaxID=2584467 RepID=UPI0025754185|nr:hypothetical protein [Methanobacterium sp. CWC-01]WJI09302.1 hypothetical protein FGU46_03910 [Methanobacterium sp. CWC-01]
MDKENNNFKKRIREEMLANHSNALERNFDLAKKFIKITEEGKVEVANKEKIGGKEQVLLYLIGKLYAKEAQLTKTACVVNNELTEELGVLDTSLRPWLKGLRDKNKIKQSKLDKYICHSIPMNLVEKTLKEIDKKIN